MHISVFDLDRTLIDGNSSFQFCLYLYRKKIFSLYHVLTSCAYYVKHTFFGMTLQELHERTFQRLLQGTPLKEIEDHVDGFVEECLFTCLYVPAYYQLKLAQHLGHYTMILSNSPSFLVKKIAEKLSVNEWKGTEYEVDKEGKLCHIANVLSGKAKAAHLQAVCKKLNVLKKDVTAYSDSHWDLPFLQRAGTAIVVNPDKKLKKESIKHNWLEL